MPDKENSHCWRDCCHHFSKTLCLLWTFWQSHLRSRPPIRCKLRKRTQMHSRIWNLLIHSVSPPNWWGNRTTQPRSWDLPPHLLRFSPWNMDWPYPYGRVCPQPANPCSTSCLAMNRKPSPTSSKLPTFRHWKNASETLTHHERSTCCAQTRTATHEEPDQIKIYPFQS